MTYLAAILAAAIAMTIGLVLGYRMRHWQEPEPWEPFTEPWGDM